VFFDRVILDLKVRGFWYSSYLHLTSLAEESLGWDNKEGVLRKEAIPSTLPSTTYGRKIEQDIFLRSIFLPTSALSIRADAISS
jgi:hypothetical protein